MTDRRTGLTWERTLSEGGYTWDAAKAYCETLTIAGGPWRLPTLKELLTIVDPTRAQPALDPVAFPDAPIDATWSASPYVRETNWYYLVYFNLGFSGYTSSGALHRVRCVH